MTAPTRDSRRYSLDNNISGASGRHSLGRERAFGSIHFHIARPHWPPRQRHHGDEQEGLLMKESITQKRSIDSAPTSSITA